MSVCGEHSVVNLTDNVYHAATLKCRSWGCPDCAPRRQAQLIASGVSGQPNRIVTLTFRADSGIPPGQIVLKLSRAWRLIRLRLMRLKGIKKLPYMATVELTKKGTPHLHILVRAPWIDQRWLSEQTKELIDAPIVDVRAIDHPGRVAGYVAKYVAKDTARLPPAKRYWSTRDWEIPKEGDERPSLGIRGGWSIWREHLADIAEMFFREGRSCTILRSGLIRAGPPLRATGLHV